MSTAYYAVFHLLIAEAVDHAYPVGHGKTDDELNDFGRRVDHKPTYDACRWVLGKDTPKQPYLHLFNPKPTVSKDAKLFLTSFIRLQDWRVFADYNRLYGFPWPFASTAVAEAASAMQLWSSVKAEPAGVTLIKCITQTAARATSKPSPLVTIWT